MLSDIELGWLAGIIDGEGCLGVSWVNKHRNATGGNVAAEVRVEATSLPMVAGIARCLDALGVSHKFAKAARRPQSTKDIYRVSVYRKDDVVKLLRLIAPHLVVKGPEASAILTWYERWPDQRGNSVERATFDEKVAFFDTLRSLKKVA